MIPLHLCYVLSMVMLFPQFSHVPRNNFNFYLHRSPIFPAGYNGKFYRMRRPISSFLHGRSIGISDATFVLPLRFFCVLFHYIQLYSYGIMIMIIFARSSKSPLIASRAIKSDKIRDGIRHIAIVKSVIGILILSFSFFSFLKIIK